MKIKKIYQGSIPENKILNSRSTSQTDTYSCEYLNDTSVVVSATEPAENRKKVWLQKGKNLFDENTNVFESGDLNTSNGSNETNSARIRTSTFIEVLANKTYTLSNTEDFNAGRFIEYDENYNFVKASYGVKTITTSNTTKYIRWSYAQTTEPSDIQLEQNATATTYEEYIEPKIYCLNDNNVYEEFVQKANTVYSTKEQVIFTKNEVDNIYYYNIYATENEVQISADIRYKFAKGTRIKVLTIEKGYEALISNTDKTLRFPISTDATGVTGYADVNSKGEVYITTLGTATATYINIRYRYK